uniref:Uncharacterized protein n=1 Tax=Peronospora matthiolae TaxID=2874970 RepID=A0AAV1U6S6_9STRA
MKCSNSLKENISGPSFFTDSILGTLNLFIELLNKKNEKTEGFIKDTLLKVLLRDFGGYSLARVLSVAKTRKPAMGNSLNRYKPSYCSSW